MSGWLTGWQYRRKHTILPSTGAGTGYQIKIVAHYGSGTTSGKDVYLGGKCRQDFGDIRFTKSDGVTELSYWIEDKVDGDYAVFWVKIDDDLSNPVDIYIYYGKPDAVTTSNGATTFLFFDDFNELDTSVWERVVANGSSTVSNSILTVVGGSGTAREALVTATLNFPPSTALRGYIWLDNVGATYGISSFGYSTDKSDLAKMMNAFYVSGSAPSRNVYAGDDSTYASASANYTIGSFRIFEIQRLGTKTRFLEHDALVTELNIDSTSNRYIIFNTRDTRTVKCDWILVRKLVDPEPEHGDWGAEELEIGVTILSIDLYGVVYSDTTITSKPLPSIDLYGVTYSDSIIETTTYQSLSIDLYGVVYSDVGVAPLAGYQSLSIDLYGVVYSDSTVEIGIQITQYIQPLILLILIIIMIVILASALGSRKK